MDFVGKYQRLNQLPEPEFAGFAVISLFDYVKQLMSEETDIEKTTMEIDIDTVLKHIHCFI